MSIAINAQNKFTKEQVLSMSEDELMELSIEDFAEAIKAAGVTNEDELFALIMNKNVSSASKEEENTFTSPLSTTVITRQEMRTYGVSTIEEAFRLIPGMIVTEKFNGIYDIQMRGLNNIPDNNVYLYTENANTLLMIDGRPVQNKVMGSINFDMLPIGIEDIERIEVVRGACSALYGADAVTGVINIITERPSIVSKATSGSVQVGNLGTTIAEAAMRKSINDKISFGATFNLQRRDRITDKLYLLPNPGQYIPTAATGEIPEVGSMMTIAQAESYLGRVIDASNGGEFTLEQIQNMRQIYNSFDEANMLMLFNGTESETPLSEMFPDPSLSRKTLGLNAYLSISPTDDINLFLSAGYQNSHVACTPANDDITSINGRKSRTAYVNLDANIKNFHIVGNYMGGVQEYVVGVPGYKMEVNNINATAEYDFKFDMGLSIRPGFFFQHNCVDDYVPVWDDPDPIKNADADANIANNAYWMGVDLNPAGYRSNYKWHYKEPGSGFDKSYANLSGLFTGEKDINTIAPSIRFDYKVNDLRLIAAFRSDKTSNPDKWNRSWQFGASYSINDDNFIRFVYGRANRGSNLVNSCADYQWMRTNMAYPNTIHIEGNPDLKVVHIDNYEIGYRWRPTNKLLIDAEAFYSVSEDYGAMMADYGAIRIDQPHLTLFTKGIISSLTQLQDGLLNPIFDTEEGTRKTAQKLFSNMLMYLNPTDVMKNHANVKYSMLPYKVKQTGISFNVDYIISPKLVAKLNGNIQSTKIDNYFEYRQIDDIKEMLSASMEKGIKPGDDIEFDPNLVPGQGNEMPPMDDIDMRGDVIDMWVDILKQAHVLAQNGTDMKQAIQTAAYAIWGKNYNEDSQICEFAKVYGQDIRDKNPQTLQNGYKHKATPTYYGTLGLIYKPVKKFEFAGFCNFTAERTYKLTYLKTIDEDKGEYSSEYKLDPRFSVNLKVAYKPSDEFEIFFNGHNLFNVKDREFVMCDKIGGLYTVGLNFAF